MHTVTQKTLSWIVAVGLVLAQDPGGVYQDGQERFRQGDLEGAEELFLKALQSDPTYAPAMMALVKVYLRQGDMVKTQDYIRQAIDTDPENEEYRAEFEQINEINTLMNQASRALNNGDTEEAYESYRLVLEKFPFFAEAAYSMGLAQFRMQDFGQAVTHFKTALELNPDHENARMALKNVAKNFFNEGNNTYRRGNLEGALDYYRKVLETDDSFYQAHYQIGVIESKLGNIEAATQAYNRALTVNPRFYKGWFALGLTQKGNDDIAGALASLEKAVEVHPGYVKAYGSMGDIYIEQKNYPRAVEVFSKAVQVDPTYYKGFLGLGICYSEQGQFDQAAAYLEQAVALNAKDAMAWFRQASAYNKLGDCSNAVRAARMCTELKPKFGGGWYELGVAEWCAGKGNKTAALNALEKARNDRSWRKMAEYELDRVKNPNKYQD